MLLAFLNIEDKNKAEIDQAYSDINKQIRKSKQDEKKKITDFLRDMDPEERMVENDLKRSKLGRWNVGMQKGLVHYDKDTYDRERRNEFIQNELGENDLEQMIQDNQNERSIDDLEADEAADIDAFYDAEASNIQELNEEYGNGDYYPEDRDEEYEQ